MMQAAGHKETLKTIYTFGEIVVEGNHGGHVQEAPKRVADYCKEYVDESYKFIHEAVLSGVDNSQDPSESFKYTEGEDGEPYQGLVAGQPGCPQNGCYYNGTGQRIEELERKLAACENAENCTRKLASLRIGKQVVRVLTPVADACCC